MGDMIKMVVVLTVLTSFSGGLLAAIKDSTKEKIEYQQLVFVKGPAIKKIMEGASNDPIVDRFKMEAAGAEKSFFVGKFDEKANAVAFETFGKGYGGDVGVMVGVNLENDEIVGVGVTTHSETPGLGSRAKTEPGFAAQFEGLSLEGEFKVTGDGGQVDALSGATITSRAVSSALTQASKIYSEIKPRLTDKVQELAQ